MRKRFFIILMCLISLSTGAQIKVVDGGDGTAVPYASVFVDGNKFAGTTDIDGLLPVDASYSGVVAVQHLNYENAEVRTDTVSGGVIRLTPRTYNIPEVAVAGKLPDYLKLTVYVRQYHLGDSVPASFKEGIYDFYVPKDGGKARLKMRSAREVFKKNMQEDNNEMIIYRSHPPVMGKKTLYDFVKEKFGAPDSAGVTIYKRSKRMGSMKINNDPKNNRYEVFADSAFVEKPLSISFFGIGCAITGAYLGEVYDIENSEPRWSNLVKKQAYFSFDYWFHGKKGPIIKDDMFEEWFVLSKTYVSKDEMKKAVKDKTTETFVMPGNIPPLSRSLQEAVDDMVPRE